MGDVTAVQNQPNGVELSAGSAHVRVNALSPNVIRVRYAPQGSFPAEHSFAVLPNTFPDGVKVQIKDSAGAVLVDTGSVQAKISRSPMRVAFLDENGKVISEDRPDSPVSFNGDSFRVWKSMPLEEHYFGLGDKMGPLDRRDLSFSLWNMDTFGYQESTDPIYKSIPFFIGMLNGAAYGIFLDNTYRSSFDFGKEFRD
ncbi:MAG TPA: alpha-glucosidase, partial [Terriglobales bacterium]|nr:alpha-glucosidase [Terriglobales bacterium]